MFNALQQLALEPEHPLAGLNLLGRNQVKRKKKTCQEVPKISELTSTSLAWHREKKASRLQYDQYRLRAMNSKRPCINYSLKRISDHMADRQG